MKYTVNLDENCYILSIAHTSKDDTELNLSDIDMKFLTAYKYVDGKIVLDEGKKNLIIIERENRAKETEIKELEQMLKDTDYIFSKEVEEITALSNPVTFITDFIKILIAYSTEYKDVISNRKQWRERIKKLKGEQNG